MIKWVSRAWTWLNWPDEDATELTEGQQHQLCPRCNAWVEADELLQRGLGGLQAEAGLAPSTERQSPIMGPPLPPQPTYGYKPDTVGHIDISVKTDICTTQNVKQVSYFTSALDSDCQRSTEDKKQHLWVAATAALMEGHTSPNESDRQWDVEHNKLDPKNRCGAYGWIWEEPYTLLRCRLCGREVRVYHSEKR